MILRVSCFLWLLLFACSVSAEVYDSRLTQPSPRAKWYSLETEHFNIHFTQAHKDYAQRLAEIAERQHQKLTQKMRWSPVSKTEIVVNDSVDFSNGASTPYPYNQFYVYMNEPTEGELKDHIDFVETLFTHEYTHILHLDQLAGAPAFIRKIFGKSPSPLVALFVMPQVFGPHWLSEGVAIHAESESGFGRNNSAVFDSKMREEVLKGLASFTRESYEGYNNTLWPFGQVYLYGAYFYQFIEERYGKAAVVDYIAQYNKNLIPWRMNSRAKKVTGKSAQGLWQEFQKYLQQRFNKDIETIKAKGLTRGQIMYSKKWSNRLLAQGPHDSIFFYHDDKQHSPVIMQLSPDGEAKEVLKITGLTSMQWHPEQGLLLSRADVCNNTQLYSDLYRYDLAKARLTRLTQCERISRADWGPSGQWIYGVQSSGAKNRLVKVDLKGAVKILSELDFGESIGQPDVSMDENHIVVAVKRLNKGWNLESYTIGTRQWRSLTDDADIPSFPIYSKQGDTVIYTASHGKQVELRKLDLNSGKIETLSNSLGFVRQGVLSQYEQIWVSEYTGKGDVIRKLEPNLSYGEDRWVESSLKLDTASMEAAKSIDTDKDYQIKPYSPWASLSPKAWGPVFAVQNQESQTGLIFQGQDALGFHRWSLSPVYYEFDGVSQFAGSASYSFYDRWLFSASRDLKGGYAKDEGDKATFYELQTNAQLLVQHPINRVDWALNFYAGIAWEHNKETQIADNTNKFAHDIISGVGLSFNNFKHYSHANTASTGIAANVLVESFDWDNKHALHQGKAGIIELQGNLTFARNQAFIATFAAGAGGEKGKPFRLGNTVDSISSLGGITRLGKRDFALRGYDRHKHLIGKSFARGSLAWHFPIASIYNGFTAPPLGLGKLKGNVFAEAGDAWNGKSDRKLYPSVGLELSAEVLIGYDNIKLPLSFGLAHGFDPHRGRDVFYIGLSLPLL
jgi:hypothetical protein